MKETDMNKVLNGKIALVTGANSGMGMAQHLRAGHGCWELVECFMVILNIEVSLVILEWCKKRSWKNPVYSVFYGLKVWKQEC